MNRDKQKALIVHALPVEGKTRLWLRNFLFLVDLEAYRLLGESITGARYRKGRRGPIVEGLQRSLTELKSEGVIRYGAGHVAD